MSDKKHTPGPWSLHLDEEDDSYLSIVDAEGEWVSQVGYRRRDVNAPDWPLLIADHTLMAAAPDLLAACEAALEVVQRREDDESEFRDAEAEAAGNALRAAIKKAKGE